MRLSELVGKEIVNLITGERLGAVGDSDLVIDESSGEIDAIILPPRGNFGGFWSDREPLIIPWDAIVKVGAEVVIVELDDTYRRTASRRFPF